MKRLLLLICFTITAFISHAQKAILIGKVTSARNESLIGVTITLKSDRNQVTKTDVEGRYSFTIDVNKKYSIVLSYVGYKTKTIENVKATQSGEELLLDVLLEEAGVKLADVTVSANRSSNKGATDNALISFQKNTNTLNDCLHQICF